MNLQENILRIRQMMGLISEEVDDACKLKNINLTTLEYYWENQSKTEQEKIKEVENFVTPIFTEAKNYMSKYIESEWFNKKVEEKIGKGSEYLKLLKNKVLPSRQNKVKDIESTNPNSEELLKAKKEMVRASKDRRCTNERCQRGSRNHRPTSKVCHLSRATGGRAYLNRCHQRLVLA